MSKTKWMSADARQELVRALAERYRSGTRPDKLHILDEFVAVTGYHRKHAIRILNSSACATKTRAPRLRFYDEAVRAALVVLWEASDRVCGKRLRPLLPLLVTALERHEHLKLDATVRSKVLSASAATIDRLLGPPRVAAGGKRRRGGVSSSVRGSIPVRTFADWKDPLPGFMEADLVAHGGETAAGSFVHSLVLTDIATGWTECVALVVRDGALIVEALSRLRETMPFPLRGFDTDNGSEFINETVIGFAPPRVSSSLGRGRIARTTKRGSSRRMAPWFDVLLVTDALKASWPPKRSRVSTRRRGCS